MADSMSEYMIVDEREWFGPGSISILSWIGGRPHRLVLRGNAADDLREILNAAPDEEHRQMILRAAVERGE